MLTDDPFEQLRATLRGHLETDNEGPGADEIRRIVRRALRPGCPPSALTRWIRSRLADLVVDKTQFGEEELSALVETVAAEIIAQLGKKGDLPN